MLEFDKPYTVGEIVYILTNGDIKNFKGDMDFLDFILSYGFGKGSKYYNKEDVECNVLNFFQLDAYGLLGEKLYKIYEACNKDKKEFIKTCDAMCGYGFYHMFDEETIKRNLELDIPVKFVDDNIVLSNGEKCVYDIDSKEVLLPRKFGLEIYSDDYEELAYEMERSLRKRINERLKEQGDDNLLEEKISFQEQKEKERIEEETKRKEEEAKRIPPDYMIDVNNLYYGFMVSKVEFIEFKEIVVLENNNVGIGRYASFRSIPDGNYLLIDAEGNVFRDTYPSMGENSERHVNIVQVTKMLDEFVNEKLNYGNVNAETIEFFGSLSSLLKDRGYIPVEELKDFYEIFQVVYENLYGPIFPKRENDADEATLEDNDAKDLDDISPIL